MWFLLVLTCLATYRVTRLLVEDTLPLVAIPRWHTLNFFCVLDSEGRIKSARRLGTVGWSIGYLVTCPWCLSAYVAAALVGLEVLTLDHVPYPWLLWLAAWAVSPNIQAREPKE